MPATNTEIGYVNVIQQIANIRRLENAQPHSPEEADKIGRVIAEQSAKLDTFCDAQKAASTNKGKVRRREFKKRDRNGRTGRPPTCRRG